MLLELQRAFRATVTGEADAVAPFVCVARGPATRRIAVYRNTVQQSLVDTLATAFPVVVRIVGARFFRALARDFVVRFPPAVPQLALYGAGFPDFIAGHERTQMLPYLADVARLEWARGECYFAADAPPLDPSQLAGLAPERLAAARLTLHPAARLVRSPFPIHRIFMVNQPDVIAVPPVDMSIPEDVLLTRPGGRVDLRLIAQADAAFVAALAAGAALAQAADAALAADAAFDLQGALQQHFARGTFAAVAAD